MLSLQYQCALAGTIGNLWDEIGKSSDDLFYLVEYIKESDKSFNEFKNDGVAIALLKSEEQDKLKQIYYALRSLKELSDEDSWYNLKSIPVAKRQSEPQNKPFDWKNLQDDFLFAHVLDGHLLSPHHGENGQYSNHDYSAWRTTNAVRTDINVMMGFINSLALLFRNILTDIEKIKCIQIEKRSTVFTITVPLEGCCVPVIISSGQITEEKACCGQELVKSSDLLALKISVDENDTLAYDTKLRVTSQGDENIARFELMETYLWEDSVLHRLEDLSRNRDIDPRVKQVVANVLECVQRRDFPLATTTVSKLLSEKTIEKKEDLEEVVRVSKFVPAQKVSSEKKASKKGAHSKTKIAISKLVVSTLYPVFQVSRVISPQGPRSTELSEETRKIVAAIKGYSKEKGGNDVIKEIIPICREASEIEINPPKKGKCEANDFVTWFIECCDRGYFNLLRCCYFVSALSEVFQEGSATNEDFKECIKKEHERATLLSQALARLGLKLGLALVPVSQSSFNYSVSTSSSSQKKEEEKLSPLEPADETLFSSEALEKVKGYIRKEDTITTIKIKGEGITLKEVDVVGDGNCGYYSMGLTREEAVEMLLATLEGAKGANIQNRVLKLMSPEMTEYIRGTNTTYFCELSNISADLNREIDKLSMQAEQQRRAVLKKAGLSLMSPQEQTNAELDKDEKYNELLRQMRELEQQRDAHIEQYSFTTQDAMNYVNLVIMRGREWLNFHNNIDGTETTFVGDALAFLMNQNLRVINPDDGSVIHSYDATPKAQETIYLIQHLNHYMRGIPVH